MNYKSQLRGFALDRAIEIAKIGKDPQTIAQLTVTADQIAAYCYDPDKDFKDCIAHISSILKESPDALAKINQMQQELGVIEEDIQRQVAMAKAVNGKSEETVQ